MEEKLQELSKERKPISFIGQPYFEELLGSGLTLDLLYLLDQIDRGLYVPTTSGRVLSLIATLKRKIYVTEELEITQLGKDVLAQINSLKSPRKAIKEKNVKIADDFDRWWAAFPSNDGWSEGNRRFDHTRTFRVEKDKCREIFAKIIKEGQFTADDMILAIQTQVAIKKRESLKTNSNKITYIKNTATWLRQADYEGYIEIAKAQPLVAEKPKVNKSFDL